MKRFLCVAALAAMLICASARGGEFKGPGYALTCPEGWTAASQDVKDELNKEAGERLKSVPNMHAIFFAPDNSTNINVVITRGSFRVDESHLQEVRDAAQKEVAAANIQSRILECNIVNVSGRNYVLMKMDNNGQMFPGPLRQWSLMGTAGGKVYTFTFSADASQASKWEPVFQQTVQSVTLDAGAMGWFSELPQAVRWGFIGGAIGGLVGVVSWAIRKSKRTPLPRRYPATTPTPPTPPPGSGF